MISKTVRSSNTPADLGGSEGFDIPSAHEGTEAFLIESGLLFSFGSALVLLCFVTTTIKVISSTTLIKIKTIASTFHLKTGATLDVLDFFSIIGSLVSLSNSCIIVFLVMKEKA